MRYFAIDGSQGEFIMRGGLTIDNAVKIKEKLVKMLSASEQLTLHIDENAEIDVAFLQLLCSAHRTASKSNKSIVMDYEKSGAAVKVIEDSGYRRALGCDKNLTGSCLWIKRGKNG